MNATILLPLACYFFATVLYHVHLFTGSAATRRAATAAMLIGVLTQSMILTEAAWTGRRPPFGRPGESLAFLAWAIAVAQLILEARSGWAVIGPFSGGIAFIALFGARLVAGRDPFEPTILQSRLMEPHVAATVLGFVHFALAFCCALLYLFQTQLLKRKQFGNLLRRLPPLETTRLLAHWLAAAGFAMLTLGIVTGVIWAMQAWKPGWYLDPKVVTSVFAWFVYAAYLYTSAVGGWRGRRTTYFLIGGFIAVLIAYYGVSFVAPSQHAF